MTPVSLLASMHGDQRQTILRGHARPAGGERVEVENTRCRVDAKTSGTLSAGKAAAGPHKG
jgi:hypothetical protein